MLIKENETSKYYPPREINEDNVQYWCKQTKELKNSDVNKAVRLMKHHCIKYLGKSFSNYPGISKLKQKYPQANHAYICLPLNTASAHTFLDTTFQKEPYESDSNKSEYILFKKDDGNFECNCNIWKKKANDGSIVKSGVNCPHILALFMCFKIKRLGQEEGNSKDLMSPDLDIIKEVE